MTSHDTIRTAPEPRQLYAPGDTADPPPSAMTPRTAEQVSRAKQLGAALRRYAAAAAALIGALGLGGVTAAAGQSPGEWVQRYGFWGALGLLALSAAEAHSTRRRDHSDAAVTALERRCEAQIETLERQIERREQRNQEMLELIMDRHAAGLGELRDEVRGLAGEVAALKEQTGPHHKLSTPPQRMEGGRRG